MNLFSQAWFSFLQEAKKAIIDSCNEVYVDCQKPFRKDVKVMWIYTCYTIATVARCSKDSQSVYSKEGYFNSHCL